MTHYTVALHLGHVGHTHTSTSRDCFHGLHKETNSGKGIALHKRSINIKIIWKDEGMHYGLKMKCHPQARVFQHWFQTGGTALGGCGTLGAWCLVGRHRTQRLLLRFIIWLCYLHLDPIKCETLHSQTSAAPDLAFPPYLPCHDRPYSMTPWVKLVLPLLRCSCEVFIHSKEQSN